MAKNKADSASEEPTKRPKGRPKTGTAKGRTPIVVTIRAGSDWEEWMDKACEVVRQRTGFGTVDRTDIIDAALTEFAARNELPAPPQRYRD